MKSLHLEQMEQTQGGGLCSTAFYVASIPTVVVAGIFTYGIGSIVVGYLWSELADYACNK